MRVFLLVLQIVGGIALSLSACRGPEDPGDGREYVSGTRLKARVLELGEADLLVEWWDEREQSACQFVLASDGHYRCLPGRFEYVQTTRKGACAPWSFGAKYLIALSEVNLSRASTDSQMRAGCFGDRVADVYEVVKRANHNCPEFYVPVQRVELRRFASARRTSIAITDRFAADVLVSEDGARGPIELRDLKHDQTCTLHFNYPAETRDFLSPESALCMPGSLHFRSEHFSEDRCEEPAYVLPDDMCAPYVNAVCRPEGRCFEAGGPYDGPIFKAVEFADPDGEFIDCSEVTSGVRRGLTAIKPEQELDVVSLDVRQVGRPVKIDVVVDGTTPLMAHSTLEHSLGRAFLHGTPSQVPMAGIGDKGRCVLVPYARDQWVCTKEELLWEFGPPMFSDPECKTRVVHATGEPRDVMLVASGRYTEFVRLEEEVYSVLFARDASGACAVFGQPGPVYLIKGLALRETPISVTEAPR